MRSTLGDISRNLGQGISTFGMWRRQLDEMILGAMSRILEPRRGCQRYSLTFAGRGKGKKAVPHFGTARDSLVPFRAEHRKWKSGVY